MVSPQRGPRGPRGAHTAGKEVTHVVLRNRLQVGNVCLVLFVAFMLTIFLGSAGVVGRASAATYTGELQNTSVSGQTFQTNVVLPQPVTPLVYESVLLRLVGRRSDGSQAFTQTIFQGVYSQIANFVYNLVYTVPSTYGVPTSTASAVYEILNNTIYYTVYLDLTTPPPEGGGGGGGPTPPTTVTTNQGTVTVDAQTGTATLVVDAQKLETQISQTAGKDVELTLPAAAAGQATKQFELPVASLDKVAGANKNLVIKADEVSFALPPGAIDTKALAQQFGADVKVTLTAKTAKAEEAAAVLKDAPAELKAAGKVIDLTLVAKATGKEGRTVAFTKTVQVAVAYDRTLVKAGSELKLGVYRYNPSSKAWDYAGGRVDTANGRVIVDLDHLSSYAVMAYEKTFTDLATHWSKDDVELMAARHVVRGMPDGSFAPEATVTRAQFAALLQRMLRLPAGAPAAATFRDVPSGAWFFGAVEAAAKAGIVTGYGDGTFGPEKMISRQEMAVMVVRAMQAGGKASTLSAAEASTLLGRFADLGAIADWARLGAAAAVKEGIIKGRTDTTFAPGANATRAESAVMIKRLMAFLDRL